MTLQYKSPIGIIKIEYSENGVSRLLFSDEAEGEGLRAGFRNSNLKKIYYFEKSAVIRRIRGIRVP